MWKVINWLFISIFLIKNCESESQCSSPYPCNSSYTYHDELKQCYKLYAGGVMHFNEAEAKCVQDGAHLASIHSDQENEFVANLAYTDGGTTSSCKWINAWIGLNFTNGNWSWTDGTPFDYTKWGCGLPQGGNKECTFTNTGHSSTSCNDTTNYDWYGFWDNDHHCNESATFIVCKHAPLSEPNGTDSTTDESNGTDSTTGESNGMDSTTPLLNNADSTTPLIVTLLIVTTLLFHFKF